MKIKRTVCIVSAVMMLSATSVCAKDNIYAYNKFISTVIGAQSGYCDIAASFAGHEEEYDDVNDYFSGLISAFYSDIDADMDNELVTVDTRGVTVYRAGENGVAFLGSIDADLIANVGDSEAYVFTVPSTAVEGTDYKKEYIGLETYSAADNAYTMYIYELSADTDEFAMVFSAVSESNEDGVDQSVWANKKTYYSYTNGGGIQATINPDNYPDWSTAAWTAAKETIGLEPETEDTEFKYTSLRQSGVETKTHIKATGLRLTDKPIVFFEDNSNLAELAETPDIVTVIIDGRTVQFPTQDPVILSDAQGGGYTMVPMRTIFEALGAEVIWQENDGVQTITATTEDTTINMTIDSCAFFVNGESKTLEMPPQLMNDKTMVPLRTVSESLGCSVDWDGDTKTVTIQSVTGR